MFFNVGKYKKLKIKIKLYGIFTYMMIFPKIKNYESYCRINESTYERYQQNKKRNSYECRIILIIYIWKIDVETYHNTRNYVGMYNVYKGRMYKCL